MWADIPDRSSKGQSGQHDELGHELLLAGDAWCHVTVVEIPVILAHLRLVLVASCEQVLSKTCFTANRPAGHLSFVSSVDSTPWRPFRRRRCKRTEFRTCVD
ncbi:unnamed protein product [Soboliphyme baturini]|uniref:Uncharacterized protein n=1 Tax=Soboliphyme baturini TaxID=241478 RepID=A0A183J441_9BILA|nr:unnamed protein product [Soboliphyme baturini]